MILNDEGMWKGMQFRSERQAENRNNRLLRKKILNFFFREYLRIDEKNSTSVFVDLLRDLSSFYIFFILSDQLSKKTKNFALQFFTVEKRRSPRDSRNPFFSSSFYKFVCAEFTFYCYTHTYLVVFVFDVGSDF